jgi:hypothetical protein
MHEVFASLVPQGNRQPLDRVQQEVASRQLAQQSRDGERCVWRPERCADDLRSDIERCHYNPPEEANEAKHCVVSGYEVQLSIWSNDTKLRACSEWCHNSEHHLREQRDGARVHAQFHWPLRMTVCATTAPTLDEVRAEK